MGCNNKYFTTVVILLLLLTEVSCKNSGSPQSVAEQFLTSFSQMDYQTAKSLSTKNTWGLLNTMAYYTDSIPQQQKKALTNDFKIKITGLKKESDSTVLVAYSITNQGKPKTLPFRKLRMVRHIDRYGHTRWKVDISTLDLLNDQEIYFDGNRVPDNDKALPLPEDSLAENTGK